MLSFLLTTVLPVKQTHYCTGYSPHSNVYANWKTTFFQFCFVYYALYLYSRLRQTQQKNVPNFIKKHLDFLEVFLEMDGNFYVFLLNDLQQKPIPIAICNSNRFHIIMARQFRFLLTHEQSMPNTTKQMDFLRNNCPIDRNPEK